MPPLAHNRIDIQGMNLLRQWIESLPGPPVLPPPTFSLRGGNYDRPVEVTFEKRTGRNHLLHAGWHRADNFRFALRKAGSIDRPDNFARESFQTGFHQKHHRSGNFHHWKMNFPVALNLFHIRTATTPHGLPGDFTRAISFSVARSITETSSDGPLAEKRYLPSGESVMPHGRLPTWMVFSNS